MKYTLNEQQLSAVSQWFDNDDLEAAPAATNLQVEIEIFGDDSMVGARAQFKWNELYLHDDGEFATFPDRDGWVSIEGDVIGWLAPDDPRGKEIDIAVVLADDGTVWLRWIGNDIYATRNGAEIEDEIKVGDHVSFSTNQAEQADYANPGKVKGSIEPGDVVDYTDPDGITWRGTLFSGVTTRYDEMEARVIWHDGHEPEDEWVNYEELRLAKD